MKRRYIRLIIVLIAIVGVLYKNHVFDKPIPQYQAENIALEYAKDQMQQNYQVQISQRHGDSYYFRLYPIKTPTSKPVDITINVYTGEIIDFRKIQAE